jgi:DNA polymerase-3 subunit epsilon
MAYVAVDFETTGLNPAKNRVIEIGAVVFAPSGEILGEFHTLVNPKRHVSGTETHGISDHDLIGAPEFVEVLPLFAEILNGQFLVAHNAPFDLRFLRHELELIGITQSNLEGLCTLDHVSRYYPGTPRRLADCCASLGLEVTEGHHALNDARMTAQLAALFIREGGMNLKLPSPTSIATPELHVAARPPLPRGAVYKDAIEGGTYLSGLIGRLPVSSLGSTTVEESEYAHLLDVALSDRALSAAEAEELFACAVELGLSVNQIQRLHRDYFVSLCEIARADHYVSSKERNELKVVALLLDIQDWENLVDSPTEISVWKPGDPIAEHGSGNGGQEGQFSLEEARTDFSDPLVSSRLAGVRVLLTGVFDEFSREQGQEAVQKRGGLTPTGLNKKTNYLVAGQGAGPAKLEKASELGVRIINATEFRMLLDGNL